MISVVPFVPSQWVLQKFCPLSGIQLQAGFSHFCLMVGYGSGQRWSSKNTTSGHLRLGVRRLQQRRCLGPGTSFRWHWTLNAQNIDRGKEQSKEQTWGDSFVPQVYSVENTGANFGSAILILLRDATRKHRN
jgi:hypothetical protein